MRITYCVISVLILSLHLSFLFSPLSIQSLHFSSFQLKVRDCNAALQNEVLPVHELDFLWWFDGLTAD